VSGRLILVGTPIGNLNDFSPRAIEALKECDFIAAEDTRVTVKLLNRFEIKKPLVSYYEHNKRDRGIELCRRMEEGETCVLVSDAGMPAISDPGEDLVALCAERGICVSVVPGPSAVVTALAVSGLPTGRFTFEGFLSVSKKSRRQHLLELVNEKRTMVFYEAPHKLKYTLEDLYEVLGERRISVVRELTKIYEEVIRTTLSKAIEKYNEESPKGEFVLVIEGATETAEKESYTLEEATRLAVELIDGGMSPSEASKAVATQTNFKKGEIYKSVLLYNERN